MNKHNYLMALAMNADVGTLHLSNADIPVKITEVESDSSMGGSPMTTFKCLVVNDDQIKYHAPDLSGAALHRRAKEILNNMYGRAAMGHTYTPYGSHHMAIDRVIFNKPATIVIWKDGTKTVVKCQEGDVYSKETGLALCIAKKALGNKGNFNEVFHEWIPEEPKAEESDVPDEEVGCSPVTVQISSPSLGEAAAKLGEDIRNALKGRNRGCC